MAALDIVGEMSRNQNEAKLFCDPADLISPTEMKNGLDWLRKTKGKQAILNGDRYVLSSKLENEGNLLEMSKRFYRAKSNNYEGLNFEEYKDIRTSVYELNIFGEKDNPCTPTIHCNCPLGMKMYWCKYKVGILFLEFQPIPKDILLLPLNKKVTKGRRKVANDVKKISVLYIVGIFQINILFNDFYTIHAIIVD